MDTDGVTGEVMTVSPRRRIDPETGEAAFTGNFAGEESRGVEGRTRRESLGTILDVNPNVQVLTYALPRPDKADSMNENPRGPTFLSTYLNF
jgi:hypothetical protein